MAILGIIALVLWKCNSLHEMAAVAGMQSSIEGERRLW